VTIDDSSYCFAGCLLALVHLCGLFYFKTYFYVFTRINYSASSATNSMCFILQTNLPVFKTKESSVRRRYSDFEWLRNELERDSKVN
jgi:hypothetical protein